MTTHYGFDCSVNENSYINYYMKLFTFGCFKQC